jgi:hypothetical protein
MGNRHANVLFLAFGVGEAQINKLDALFFDHFQNVGCCFRHTRISHEKLRQCSFKVKQNSWCDAAGSSRNRARAKHPQALHCAIFD